MRAIALQTILAAATLAFVAPAAAQSVRVSADQVERVHLRGAATDVVIGNPAVADVALIDPRTLAVTGKTPGVTSLVVFDGSRRVLFEGPVSVSAGAAQVSMVRGAEAGPAEERVFTCIGVCTARGR